MIELKANGSIARIENGELISLEVEGHEFIHQKGSPGWGSSDTEMFPIIGPVNEAGFRVQVSRGTAVQDQHGLLRQMSYELVSQNDVTAVFSKSYKADTPVLNSKYPNKSPEEYMTWPYDFQFQKSFVLKENQLEITFKVTGEEDMPFMLGYHPAFKLHSKNPEIVTPDGTISLDQVLEVGSRALQIADTTSITLRDEKSITIKTEGFGHFMCWTEVRNMVCIEPITFYPYAVDQHLLHEGFDYLHEQATFKVTLSV